jgi:hypothetical protein
VARLRLEDAAVLLKEKRYNGAIYLAGYAIECQLKFAVCDRRGMVYLPSVLEVHDWDRLVDQAGLAAPLSKQRTIATLYATLSEEWAPLLRYRAANYDPHEAHVLYKQMCMVYEFLNELTS